jgi:hypothetical protein
MWTLEAMDQLGVAFYNGGRYREALEMQEPLLEVRQRVQGEEHPDTFIAIVNLSSTLYHMGEYRVTVHGLKGPKTPVAPDA